MGIDYIAINREAYDKLTDHYRIRRVKKSIYEEPSNVLADFLLDKYPRNLCEATFLEVGPGNGEILSLVEKKVKRSYAVELSESIISLCKEVSKKSTFICGNILDVDLKEKGFDLIFLGAVIHLFPKVDAKRLLSKLKRSLSDHGLIFLNTTISDRSSEGFHRKNDASQEIKRFRKYWTEQEFLGFIEESGLKIVDRKYTYEQDRSKVWIGVVCCKKQGFKFADHFSFVTQEFSIVKRLVNVNEHVIDFEFVQRKNVVLVIPILDKKHTILVKQYRSSVNQFILEFPAGKIEANESVFEAARRELREEAGYDSDNFEMIASFLMAPHFTDEKVMVLVAKKLRKVENSPSPKEYIAVKKMRFLDLVRSEEIIDGKTIIALSHLKKKISHEGFYQ